MCANYPCLQSNLTFKKFQGSFSYLYSKGCPAKCKLLPPHAKKQKNTIIYGGVQIKMSLSLRKEPALYSGLGLVS